MTGELHHYKFNESSGDLSYDSKNPSTYLAGLTGTFTSGKINNGFQVNADVVNMKFKPSDITTDKMTVCFWIKRITGNWALNGNSILRSGTTGNDWYVAQRNTNVLYIGTGVDAQITSTALSLNVWYHVTVVWDKSISNTKVYLNGNTAVPDMDYNKGIIFTDADIYFNSMSNGTFVGTNYVIDDIRFYGVTLSNEEIAEIYNLGVGTENSLDQQPSYTIGQAGLRTNYPIEEGLTAGTQKQTGRVQNLVAEEGTTVLLRDKALI